MKLAIIGAGMAGLAAARHLRGHNPTIAITLFEKSRGLGGRAATRRRDGFAFDHGAQYFKTPTPALEQLIRHDLATDELFDIGKPVWTFDATGTIAEGDPQQNADPKWSYRRGLSMLGKLLGEGLTVRREVRIAALHLAGSSAQPRWALIDEHGNQVDQADLVLMTPPAPQSAAIIAASQLPAEYRDRISAGLDAVPYRRCISFALAYDRLIPRPFYALINSDRSHPIAWLALEHDKGPQHCPPGKSLIIAQMAPQWSLDHWEQSVEQNSPIIAAMVGDLLAEDLDDPLWADRQGWRYALPDGIAQPDSLDLPEIGLFFAGDYTAGQGRVHLAIEQGWRTADTILATLPNYSAKANQA